MARDQVDMTPIETRDALVAWFAEGCKRRADYRIGTEHEKFAFTVEGHRPVPYEGRRSIRALLEGMRHLLGWEPIMENGHILCFLDVTRRGWGGVALARRPVRTVRRAGRDRAPVLPRAYGTSRPAARDRSAARHRLS